MGLHVGNMPVKEVYVGSTPVREVHVGSERIWTAKETVQITLGNNMQARDQLRSALSDHGLSYQTVKAIPFEIELVGSGKIQEIFAYCSALTHVPAMNTSNVTDMQSMFYSCWSLTHVPDMDTSSVTNMSYMFRNCEALTDGNVRLIGRNPQTITLQMIAGSGLTREPFYDTAGNPI